MTLPPFPPRIDSITAEVRRIVADCFDIDATDPRLQDTSTPLTEFGADSLDAVDISMTLETEFGIEVDAEDIGTGSTIADIAALVSRKLGAPVPA